MKIRVWFLVSHYQGDELEAVLYPTREAALGAQEIREKFEYLGDRLTYSVGCDDIDPTDFQVIP